MTLLTTGLDWPDVEDVTTEYLTTALAARSVTAKVGTLVPRPIVGLHVRVQRTGGSISDVWDRARITLELRGPRKEDAHDLAVVCRDLMRQMPGTRSTWLVTRWSETGLAYLPDAEDGSPRYLLTVLMTFRAKLRAS